MFQSGKTGGEGDSGQMMCGIHVKVILYEPIVGTLIYALYDIYGFQIDTPCM